jgi:GT2 family glycosyltransferase
VDLSIVIVNWNVCELLRRCLASIKAHRGNLSIEIIVVDNASADDSVGMIQREFPEAHLIASPENLGYTRGNNLGVTEAQGRYLLILNPDTEIVGDVLQQMMAYLDKHPEVGVVGPQLLYPDGSIQSSRRRFPHLMTAFFLGTPLSWRWFPNSKLAHLYNMADKSDHEIQPVDWLVGAALMIRRETWQAVGPLDETFFMYFEEVDWCYRCRQAGWEIHYLPMAQIIHHEHKSADKVPVATWIRLYRSRIRYFRKYFGAGWATLIQLFLLLNFAWLLAEEAAKWAVGGRQKERRQWIQTYWQVLKSGLR